MKRIISVWVGSLLILTSGHLVAQENVSGPMLKEVTVTATNTKVPQKVRQNFLKYYPEAVNPRWYDLQNKFFVKYYLEDEPSQSLFTKRGNLIYTITYGNEKDLPEAIRQDVKRKYIDFTIRGVTKVSDQYDVVWMVHLEGATNYITVRMTGKEMEEVQKLNKS